MALRAFLTSPDVVEARIVKQGRVLAKVSNGSLKGEGFMVTAALASIGPDARLEFFFSTAQISRQIRTVTTRILFLVGVVLAAGIFGAYALSLRVIRRLERTADVAGAIARGDYSQRLVEDGPAEFAAVSGSFNAMVDALAASRQELLHANASLETRVRERTRELVEAQDELVEAERLGTVGEMSAQLAHDLRNPLAALAVNTELIGDELSGCACAGRVAGLLQATQRSIARADVALADYLGFAGLAQVQPLPRDLNGLLRAEAGALAEWLRSRRVVTVFDLAESLPPVAVDERRFRLAIRCLVRHAADAMRDGGTLTLSTARHEASLQLRIRDTGDPIGDDIQKDLFKLFCGLRPNSGGPGLRLAREVLQIHGGTLDLERTDAGGSTFLAILPV